MKYIILLLLTSCASIPKYGFLDEVVFRHNDPFYEQSCSTVGRVEKLTQTGDGFVYTIGSVVCRKGSYSTTSISLQIPEENIIHKIQ